MELYQNTYNDRDLECPYCHEEQGDSWEYVDQRPLEHDCDSCGKSFICWKEVSVSYHAQPTAKEAEVA